jgi:hypothetical protein
MPASARVRWQQALAQQAARAPPLDDGGSAAFGAGMGTGLGAACSGGSSGSIGPAAGLSLLALVEASAASGSAPGAAAGGALNPAGGGGGYGRTNSLQRRDFFDLAGGGGGDVQGALVGGLTGSAGPSLLRLPSLQLRPPPQAQAQPPLQEGPHAEAGQQPQVQLRAAAGPEQQQQAAQQQQAVQLQLQPAQHPYRPNRYAFQVLEIGAACPTGYASLLRRCLDPDPGRRPSALEVAAGLQEELTAVMPPGLRP